MCEQAGQPSGVTEALAMLDRALDHLNAADAASLPSAVQAQALRVLERAGAKHTAARARVLGAFVGQAAYEDDGQGSARAWLRWQTRITKGAAAGAVGWVRRLANHPVIGNALAAGELSESWAKQVCEWTRQLPPAQQSDADEILLGAARAGVDLDGLAGLAQEMYERSRQGQGGGGDEGRFDDRFFRLGVTFRGAGRAEGDLTPGCAAALDTVLESLGKKAGPEDRRTADQRRHDALEEACQRLIKGGMLPGRTRQPAHVNLHMTLSQLRDMPGAAEIEDAWAAARASQTGWLTGPEAGAAACDSRLAPVVTGSIDWQALDKMTALYLATHGLPTHGLPIDGPVEPTFGSSGQHQAPGHGDAAACRAGAGADDGGPPGQAGPVAQDRPDQHPPPGDPAARGPQASDRRGTAQQSGTGHGQAPGHGAAAGTAEHEVPGRGGASGQTGTGDRQALGHGSAAGPAGTRSGQASRQIGAADLTGSGDHQTPGRGRKAPDAGPSPDTGPAQHPDPGRLGACGCTCGRCGCPVRTPLSPATLARLRQTMLRLAADVMSGPAGLAAALRTGQLADGPGGSRSMPLAIPIPLDTGQATPTIPANLVRAVCTRHRHCAFPGCRAPVRHCDIHHLTPRSQGGATALDNLVPLCQFHHLMVIHEWGWILRLNPDGTTTAVSPDGRALSDHGPPQQAA